MCTHSFRVGVVTVLNVLNKLLFDQQKGYIFYLIFNMSSLNWFHSYQVFKETSIFREVYDKLIQPICCFVIPSSLFIVNDKISLEEFQFTSRI